MIGTIRLQFVNIEVNLHVAYDVEVSNDINIQNYLYLIVRNS